MPASPYAYPVHHMLPADVPLPQPVGEAGLAGAAVMMQPSCIEVITCWLLNNLCTLSVLSSSCQSHKFDSYSLADSAAELMFQCLLHWQYVSAINELLSARWIQDLRVCRQAKLSHLQHFVHEA